MAGGAVTIWVFVGSFGFINSATFPQRPGKQYEAIYIYILSPNCIYISTRYCHSVLFMICLCKGKSPTCFFAGHADQDGDNRISEEEYRNVLRTPQASWKWDQVVKIASNIGSITVDHWWLLQTPAAFCYVFSSTTLHRTDVLLPRSPPKAMAALTSLGVDVEAALDYGALGRCFRVSGMLGMFIQLVGYHHHKSKHFGGYMGILWRRLGDNIYETWDSHC